MPKKGKSKRCANCIHLYTDYSSKEACWYSERTSSPNSNACKSFKMGVPFLPRMGGKLSKLIKGDPEEPQSFTFYISPLQCFVFTWDPKINSMVIHLVGLSKSGGILTREYVEGEDAAALHGIVKVIGAGGNSLYTSPNFNDPHVVDEDKAITDKPMEVHLVPVKLRKRIG